MEEIKPCQWYQQLPCGIILTDPDGLILQANSVFCEMVGYAMPELIKHYHWQDLLSVGGKIFYQTHYAPLLRIQGFVKEVNVDFVQKKGTKIPTMVNTGSMKDHQGNLQYFSMAICEMQQRKKYEKELLIAKKEAEKLTEKLLYKNKALEEFTRVISHDIKAPLNNIISITDLLMSSLNLQEADQRLVAHIENNSKQLVMLVNGILDYYRESQPDQLSKEYIDFNQLITDLVNLLDFKKEHDIIFPKEHIHIHANKINLQQILINLITNAIKYNQQSKVRIEINVLEYVDFYHFSVKDNGNGISKKSQAKVFQLFTTLGQKDRFGNYGTGIGLATVKRLIDQQGGHISLDSEEGVGTTFYFSLKK
jgi:PAS domain S-box-containing protein